MESHIKFIAIGKVKSGSMLLAFSPEKSTKKAYLDEYMKEAKENLEKLATANAYPDLRDDSEGIYGNWFIQCDKHLVSYAVLVATEYKKDVAY
jgi:hypothetical protein